MNHDLDLTFSMVFRCTDICSWLLLGTLGMWSSTQWLGGLGNTLGEGGSLNLAPAYVFFASFALSSDDSSLLVILDESDELAGFLLSLFGHLTCLLFWERVFRLWTWGSCWDDRLGWVPLSTLPAFDFTGWGQKQNKPRPLNISVKEMSGSWSSSHDRHLKLHVGMLCTSSSSFPAGSLLFWSLDARIDKHFWHENK